MNFRLGQRNIRHYSERFKWSQSEFVSTATLWQLKMKVTTMTLLQNPFKLKADLLGGSEGSFVTVWNFWATLWQLKLKVTAMTLLQNPFKPKAGLLGDLEGSFVTVWNFWTLSRSVGTNVYGVVQKQCAIYWTCSEVITCIPGFSSW